MPLEITYSTGIKAQLTLQDIEDIYKNTFSWDRTTPVRVSSSSNQRDGSSVSMTVTQDPRKNNQPKGSSGSRGNEFL